MEEQLREEAQPAEEEVRLCRRAIRKRRVDEFDGQFREFMLINNPIELLAKSFAPSALQRLWVDSAIKIFTARNFRNSWQKIYSSVGALPLEECDVALAHIAVPGRA